MVVHSVCLYISLVISDYMVFGFNKDIHIRIRIRIHVPIGRTEAIYKTFSYFGAHIWNHISSNISTNVSYSSFKHLLKFSIQNNIHVIYRLNI